MKLKTGLILIALVSWIFISTGSVFGADEIAQSPSSEAQVPLEATATPELQATAPTQETPDLQWVWAEVISVSPQNNQLTLKYLDYEADAEKEMVMGVDDKTTYENVKSLSEIKASDAVSVDYITNAEGKNIAKNINVEKPEAASPQAEETTKAPAKEETKTQPATTTEAAPAPETNSTETQSPTAGQNQQ
jgi:hypothetical protein